MLAQVIPTDTTDLVNNLIGSWQPYVAFVSPVLLGLITSEKTRDAIKRALPVFVAALLGVISILSEDGMTWAGLVFRVPALWVFIESGYRSLSGVATLLSRERENISINDVLGKSFGLIR